MVVTHKKSEFQPRAVAGITRPLINCAEAAILMCLCGLLATRSKTKGGNRKQQHFIQTDNQGNCQRAKKPESPRP